MFLYRYASTVKNEPGIMKRHAFVANISSSRSYPAATPCLMPDAIVSARALSTIFTITCDVLSLGESAP